MNYDYAQLTHFAAYLLIKYGTRVKHERDGSALSNTYGVFVERRASDMTAPVTSAASGTTNNTREMLLPGTMRHAPQVGDYLTSDKEKLYITEVETVRPAGSSLLYKVSVT